MGDILTLIESLAGPVDPRGRAPLKNFGLISCDNSVHIRQIPFYEPCIIVILSGRKQIFNVPGTMVCEAGTTITVPAPTYFSMRNEVDPRGRYYKALIIPFHDDDLERLRQAHKIKPVAGNEKIGILHFEQCLESLGDRALMLADGAVAWLDIPLTRVIDRVPADGRRPLASDRAQMELLYAKRQLAYAHAHVRIDATKPVAEVVGQLLEWIDF